MKKWREGVGGRISPFSLDLSYCLYNGVCNNVLHCDKMAC